MKKPAKLLLALVLSVAVVQGALAVSSVARSKNIIRDILRHDAALPSNAQLSEIGLAFLYHPVSRPIIMQYLSQEGLVINPVNKTVLEDIGTLDPVFENEGTPEEEIIGEVFTPSSAATINQYISSVHRRNLRKYHIDVLRAYRLLTADAPALPIKEARASVINTADIDGAVIVGDNEDDPES